MVDLLKKVDLANSIGDLSIAVQVVKDILNKSTKLLAEERKAFSTTYRALIAVKKDERTDLNYIIEDKESVQVDKTVAESVKKDVETEIKRICDEVFVSKLKVNFNKFSYIFLSLNSRLSAKSS
jgi:14-3-3 protein